jgi:hypothetical protein
VPDEVPGESAGPGDLAGAAAGAAAAGKALGEALGSTGPTGAFEILPALADAGVKLSSVAGHLAATGPARPGGRFTDAISTVAWDIPEAAAKLAARAGDRPERDFSARRRPGPPQPAPGHVREAAAGVQAATTRLADLVNLHRAAGAGGQAAGPDEGAADSVPRGGLAAVLPAAAELADSLAECAIAALPRHPRMEHDTRRAVEDFAATMWQAGQVFRTTAATSGIPSTYPVAGLRADAAQQGLTARSFPEASPLSGLRSAAGAGGRKAVRLWPGRQSSSVARLR